MRGMVLDFLPTANPPLSHLHQTIQSFFDDKDLRPLTKVSCSPWLPLVLYCTKAKKKRLNTVCTAVKPTPADRKKNM